jgi:hypothetical protein
MDTNRDDFAAEAEVVKRRRNEAIRVCLFLRRKFYSAEGCSNGRFAI